MEQVKKQIETDEEKVDRLMSEHFDKHYNSFEEFQKDFLEKIGYAKKQIEEGKVIPMEQVVAEMEAKFHINEKI